MIKHWHVARYTIILLISIYLRQQLQQAFKPDQSLGYHIQTDLCVMPVGDVWLTVFVHGTIVLHPRFLIENIAALKHDKAESTLYGQVINDARSMPFFFQTQAMQEPGLRKINEPFDKRGYASGALVYLLQHIQNAMLPTQKTCQHYYTFGWSGIISDSARVHAGAQLHHELTSEIEHYKKQGICPKVRLIGYSHGGNVCLNTARSATYSW